MDDLGTLLDGPSHVTSSLSGPDSDVVNILCRIRGRFADRITSELILSASEGRYADFPFDLDPRLTQALRGRGIARLYSHECEAWKASAAGRHTVIVTPTAWGKSLCYNLPALHSAVTEQAKALYLFPTKALAQAQLAELLALNEAGKLGVCAYTFDDDTPGDARKSRAHVR